MQVPNPGVLVRSPYFRACDRVLASTLIEPISMTRRAALEALEKLGLPPTPLQIAIGEMSDEVSSTREEAAEVLEELGAPEAVSSLLQALNHGDGDV